MTEKDHVDALMASLISDGATGALEVKSAKKRWLFFFSGGALTYTRSNLKSEQLEQVAARMGGGSKNELVHHQAVRRVRNVLRATDISCTFHDQSPPPKVTPMSAVTVLFEGIRAAYTAPVIEARIQPLLDGYPRVTMDTGGLGFDHSLEDYLLGIDGGRPGRDVIAFGPATPDTLCLALLTLWLLGGVETSPEPLSLSSITAIGATAQDDDLFSSAAAPPAAPPAAPAAPAAAPKAKAGNEMLDLGALLADAVASHDHTAQPLPAASPRPTSAITPLAASNSDHPLAKRLFALAQQMSTAKNHFELLGVPHDGTSEDYRRAYNDLARELHPDRYHDGDDDLKELATSLFDQIRSAWEVLGNDAARAAYIDVAIHGKKTEEEEALEQLNAYWAADDAFRKGLTIFKNGRIKASHGLFKQAALAVPDELEFQAYYGYTSFSLNRTSDPDAAEVGLSLLRDVLERNKNQERKLDSGWVLLGRAFREKGQLETARRALVQALRINPASDAALREMRRLERAQKSGRGSGFLSKLFGPKKKK